MRRNRTQVSIQWDLYIPQSHWYTSVYTSRIVVLLYSRRSERKRYVKGIKLAISRVVSTDITESAKYIPGHKVVPLFRETLHDLSTFTDNLWHSRWCTSYIMRICLYSAFTGMAQTFNILIKSGNSRVFIFFFYFFLSKSKVSNSDLSHQHLTATRNFYSEAASKIFKKFLFRATKIEIQDVRKLKLEQLDTSLWTAASHVNFGIPYIHSNI